MGNWSHWGPDVWINWDHIEAIVVEAVEEEDEVPAHFRIAARFPSRAEPLRFGHWKDRADVEDYLQVVLRDHITARSLRKISLGWLHLPRWRRRRSAKPELRAAPSHELGPTDSA
jgi:hypothetical protein